MIYLEGEFYLRLIEEKDLVPLAVNRNFPSTYNNLTHSLPVTFDKQLDWLKGLGKENMYYIICHKADDIGVARINDIEWINRNASVGLDIYERWRGKHLAKSSFRMISNYAFDVLNMERLWLLVREDNVRAIETYESYGFQQEGIMRHHLFKNGKWYDYLMMGCLRDERTPNPPV